MPTTKTTLKSLVFAALAASAAAGCTVGPDFESPQAEVPDNWKGVSATQSQSMASPGPDSDPRWWQTFNDPILNSLVDRAVDGNLSFQQTVIRIKEARAQEAIARAAALPSLSANASYTREKLGEDGLLSVLGGGGQAGIPPGLAGGIGGLTQATDLYQVGFDATWELDIFGKVRRSVEQAGAEAQEQVETRNDALVSLEAEVARSYFNLRSGQNLLSATQQAAIAQSNILDLTLRLRSQGMAAQLDVDQAQIRLMQTQTQEPGFEQQVEQAMNDLAVLLGRQPGTLDTELKAPQIVPRAPPTVAVSVPSTLLRRRPDIRKAEALLHAATANIGVAIAQLYPDITLSGEAGQRSLTFGGLANWGNNFYQFGPSISLPIFQGGQLRANVRLAKAQQEEAALGYRQTVLSALQEVENDLVAFRKDREKQRSFGQVEEQAADELSLAKTRYQNGLGDFIDVLNAESALVSAQQDTIRADDQVSLDTASLYKAIGGGWEIETPAGQRSSSLVGKTAASSKMSTERSDRE